MNSVWREEICLPKFERQTRDLSTDILIIGGGIAGILCAYMLEAAGADYLLVEADTICGGVTKNTTAKITSQHSLIYELLLREWGLERASLYFEANERAIGKYRELSNGIDCDFEEKSAFVYSLDSPKKLENEMVALEKIGYRARFKKTIELPFPVAGAIEFTGQAQFNPLKFLSAIARDLKIYEHTRVRELIGNTAVTSYGRISAKKIIVASHFPFINKHGSYFMKMYQHRSYVIALEGASEIHGMYVDENDKGLSFRNYNGLLLIGGGSHRTGKKGGGWRELEATSKKLFPGAIEKYRWATQDCMTLDGAPYIGRYSALTDNLFVATGFNKWGMTSAMVSAMLLSDMVLGCKNRYEKVFSPSRTILRPQLAVNAFEAATNLLSFSGKRCPHLGCTLKWNNDEHSWDCPCHGSRFTEHGKLIDNPATGDKKSLREPEKEY